MTNKTKIFLAIAVAIIVLSFSFKSLENDYNITEKIIRGFNKNNTTGNVILNIQKTEETSYVYGNGLVAQVKNGNIEYFHNDYLGSPTMISDSSGNKISEQKYDVFGNSLTPEISTLEFTGKEKDDDTGLHYFNARYYDSSTGKFTTSDTVKPKLTNPQSLNLYTYTLNNPLKYIDPTGNQEETVGSTSGLIDTTIDFLKKWRGANKARAEIEFYNAYAEDLEKVNEFIGGEGGELLMAGDIEGFKKAAMKSELTGLGGTGMISISKEGKVSITSPEALKGIGALMGGPSLQRMAREQIAGAVMGATSVLGGVSAREVALAKGILFRGGKAVSGAEQRSAKELVETTLGRGLPRSPKGPAVPVRYGESGVGRGIMTPAPDNRLRQSIIPEGSWP